MELPQDFIDSLIALKNYYQAQVEEYERQFTHAKKQLNHVNALLDDQMARQYKQPTSRQYETEVDNSATASETAFHNRAIASASNLPPDTSPSVAPSPDFASAIGEPQASIDQPISLELTQLPVEPAVTEVTVPLTTDLSTDKQPVAGFAINEPNQSLSVEPDAKTEAISNAQLPQQPTASPVANDLKTKRSRQGTPQKTPLLPPYQHLSKSEAVEKFLQDNEGKAFYIDQITLALYGELEAEAIRAERPRIYDTLKKGVAKGLWSVIPNSVNYYTIDLKSLEPTAKELKPPEQLPKSPQLPSRRSKYSDSMLPRYRQLSFSEAVATVVQENAGQVLTPERVARELYGNVSKKALTEAQDQVGKALWAGAKQGRWQRVPGQLGQYTLNLKLI